VTLWVILRVREFFERRESASSVILSEASPRAESKDLAAAVFMAVTVFPNRIESRGDKDAAQVLRLAQRSLRMTEEEASA
jgi:hypothetical protein